MSQTLRITDFTYISAGLGVQLTALLIWSTLGRHRIRVFQTKQPRKSKSWPGRSCRILKVWEDIGLHLDRKKIAKNLRDLAAWKSQWTGKTIGKGKTSAY